MKASKTLVSIAVAVIIGFQLFSAAASGHTGENFMIIRPNIRKQQIQDT